jgi:hemolysin activation/secretion protein
MRASTFTVVVSVLVMFAPAPVAAQQVLDRTLPSARMPVEAEAPVRDSPPPVDVQVEQAESLPRGQEVIVGAITLTGLEALKPADFADVISPRLGQSLDDAGLRALAAAIAQEAQARGYAFATARIEPQRLSNGVLTIDVSEGRIDEVRLEGPDEPAVRAALAPLVSGTPVRLDEVERRLLIAGDIDGITIRNSRYLREDGRGVLLVEVSRDAVVGTVAVSNEGTKPLGPVQARLEADVNGLLAGDDSLSLSYTGTPLDPRELQFGFVRYEKRVSAAGTELALTGSFSQSRPGAYLRGLGLRGRSWYVAASVLQPLWRRRDASMWFQGELGLNTLLQWRNGTLIREDRSAVARATVYGFADFAGGRLRSSLRLSQGLGILGATETGDPLASRVDADGTFTSLYAWSDWTRPLGSSFSVRLAAQGQMASQPLLISDEISLGGSAFLRGYDWSERSGDDGIMGTAELGYDWGEPLDLFPNVRLFAFVDAGRVSNIDSDLGSGSLASTGGGVRADLGDSLLAAFQVAVPLSGPRYDTGDESPKINLWLAKTF